MNSSKLREMPVDISKSAFLSLIIGVTEVYNKECIGFLLGKQTRSRFIVECAYPFQCANRTPESVDVKPKHWRGMYKTMKDLPGAAIVGEYHSHPESKEGRSTPALSEFDLDDDDGLQIVVGANDAKIGQEWYVNKDGDIIGTLGNISMKIRAYYILKKKPVRLRIRCKWM